MLQRILIPGALVVVLALAGAAFAGNGAGPKSSASTITGPVVVSTASANGAAVGQAQFGDRITFNVSLGQTGNPFVNLNCYQNGVNVYNSWDAFWPAAGSFVLSSPAWTNGAANCTADLGTYTSGNKFKVLASTSFTVVG